MPIKKNLVSIGNRLIGQDEPCFLIAEVGTTCLGNLKKAKDLIDAAANAGMDAIKFQVIDPDQISDKSASYNIMINGVLQQANMYEMFTRLAFTEAEWMEIHQLCHSRGLLFFATVDFMGGVDLLERVGVAVHKIGAWDAAYKSLITHIGKTGKPMFVDLGPATESEVETLVNWYIEAGGSSVLFMHDFHTQDDRQMHLHTIRYLKEKYPNWPVGFSSPARDDDLDIAALTLGSAYVEKRLILNRLEPAFHAHESLEPKELKDWVDRIRHIERALGKDGIFPSDADLEGREKFYRSACTLRKVNIGEQFTVNNLGAKRPGTGIPAASIPSLWGRKALRSLDENTLISESDFE